jgi:hypothetical protein
MSLLSKVKVNTHYTRSVNLERDRDSLDVVKAYIPTSRALRTLSRIADTFHEELAPRAWSLIGPYGSGKSSFSVFMAQLLSSPDDAIQIAAQEVLGKSDSKLAKKFAHTTAQTQGYMKVLLTGAPEPLGRRLARALSDSASTFWAGKRRKNAMLLEDLHDLAQLKSPTISDILKGVKALQVELQKSHVAGLLIVIDELGKFLEYEARHYGANDIFLLQELAELACKGSKANLLLFVMLHQSFEQYAKGLGENLKNEWSKVQGRFEEVPFLESTEQVLRVVSCAFSHSLSKVERAAVTAKSKEISLVLQESDALPGALSSKEAAELFDTCYPLHPVTAILLPMLCQKIAQNERTLFSYLGSHEEFGFQDVLGRLGAVDEYIYPHDIYDYFITNQSAALGDYMTSRRWAEVVTAIERLGDAKKAEINLLKTIGILNIVGSKGGFKASKALLETCIEGKASFSSLAKSLKDKSVVNFRRFNNEFRVWQGSDFDLEEALQEERNELGSFALADELNAAGALLPIVARRYTIENGALRYFNPVFVDAKSYKSTAIKSDDARIVFYLAAGQDDQDVFHDAVKNHFCSLDIVVLCLGGAQLREAVAETQALKKIRIKRQELNSDPVAKREFEDRLTAAEVAEDKLLNQLTDLPQDSEWFYLGKRLAVAGKRSLQEALSSVLSTVFSQAPAIHNELLNRDKPSAQANAARNKLLYAMLNSASLPDLGIDKYPPEKSIYRSLLRATGIHRLVSSSSGEWVFAEPQEESSEDKYKIGPVWSRVVEFLDATERKAQSFSDLNNELMAPPYGVKAGLLPVLYIAVYMTYKHELAIYENGRYLPFLNEEKLDRFVKRPDEFAIQRFRIEGLKASIFEHYQRALFSDTKQRTVVELISPLANFIGGLPRFTKITRSPQFLDVESIAVRDAFETASSPEKLLFELLPRALGFSGRNDESIEGFSEAIRRAVTKLKYAYSELLKHQRELLCEAFDLRKDLPLKELRGHFQWYSSLLPFTIERDGLKAFLLRLCSAEGSDEEWFESVASFLGRLPTEQWTDVVCREVEYKLADFSGRAIDLHKLFIAYREHKIDSDTDELDVYVLKSVKLRGDSFEQVVTVSKAQKALIEDARVKFKSLIGDTLLDSNPQLVKALLAELVSEALVSVKAIKQKTTRKAKAKGGDIGKVS